jgi:hypothetical protein
MIATVALESRTADYLSRLDLELSGISTEQKEDILQEIRAHIMDSLNGSADQQSALERVLHLLGSPRELAERYRTETLLTRASSSFSPWVLFQTSWRWAKMGMKGMVAFFIALTGYGIALGWMVTAMLKPFMPSVGLWIGGDTLQFGPAPDLAGKHELLGNYYIPVVMVLAFATAIGTTQALRWLMRRRIPRLIS